MSEIISFSADMLKTFLKCQKLFEYKYIKKIIMPSDASLATKGKNIHAMANYYLKGENISKLEKCLTSDELILWNNLKSNKYFNYDYVKSEYGVMSKIDKYWLNGRLDALVKNNDDYFILDYKTGTLNDDLENDFQTIVYLYSIDKLLKRYSKLSFVYIDLKNNENKIIEFDENLKEKYSTILLDILNKISFAIENNVYKTLNAQCACVYRNICNKLC